jgi:hypothetical protein
VHSSVSATGWRTHHPQVEETDPVMKEYWNQKEETEDVIRRSGLQRWTIFKPAFYMENFLPPRREYMFSDLPAGKLVIASNPQTVMALICADEFEPPSPPPSPSRTGSTKRRSSSPAMR